MVKSNFSSIDEYVNDWFPYRPISNKYNHLAFIILENNDIPWTWYKEKLLQLITWNMQGGVTGAGSGHPMYFCHGDILETLKQAKEDGRTHAMVCQIGMILCGFTDQVVNKTPIQNFHEFTKSDQFMRAHILARPDKPASIHLQHFEINLETWNGKSFLQLGNNYTRSEKNIHDDYTPLWIDTDHHPRIHNFTPEQRNQKWFTYPHRDYKIQEQKFYDYIKTGKRELLGQYSSSEVIIRGIYEKKLRKRFYYENNERLHAPDEKYDIIFAPTAGYIAEFLYDRCGHKDTEVIIFDYDSIFLDIKRKILEMGLVGEDLIRYMVYLQEKQEDNTSYLFSAGRTPNQFDSIKYNEKNVGDWQRIRDNLDIHGPEYVLCNLIEDDLSWIGERVKDKSVHFYASNIFKYYVVNMKYDYIQIKSQYRSLMQQLEKSNNYNFVGSTYK